MSTLHLHRLIVVSPEGAKVTGIVNWFSANIGANSVSPAADWPPLNATGLAADPVSHRWMCGSWQETECREILKKLCDLAAVTKPTNAQWTAWSRQEKIDWLVSVRTAIHTNYGVYVSLSSNDGQWDSPAAILTTLGLKTIAAAA